MRLSGTAHLLEIRHDFECVPFTKEYCEAIQLEFAATNTGTLVQFEFFFWCLTKRKTGKIDFVTSNS